MSMPLVDEMISSAASPGPIFSLSVFAMCAIRASLAFSNDS